MSLIKQFKIVTLAKGQPSEQTHQIRLLTIVKDDPPKDASEVSSFCYETVTKEEVILVEPVSEEPPAEIPNELKCSECKRTFDKLSNLQACLRKHKAIRLELYKCRYCGRCFGTKFDNERHEGVHKKGMQPAVDVSTVIPVPEPDVSVSVTQTVPIEEDLLLEDFEEAIPISKIAVEKADKPAAVAAEPITDESSSTFCYETVIKEELIIEDDAFGDSVVEDEPEESSRCTLSVGQPLEDEARIELEGDFDESLDEQSAPERLKCDKCQMIFYKRYHLQMHYRTHNPVVMRPMYEELLIRNQDTNNFTCSFCETFCSTRDKALAHVQKHIYVIDGIYQCSICGLRCGGQVEHLNHKKTHTNSSEPVALPTEAEDSHMEFESSSRVACEKSDLPLHCKTCNVFFNNATNFTIHLWKSTLRIFRAKVAAAAIAEDQSVRSKKQVVIAKKPKKIPAKKKPVIRDRVKVVTKETGPFSCFKCDYKTTKKQLFLDHNRGHKAIELGLFKCDLCGTRVRNRRQLVLHAKVHERSLECQTCHETFETRTKLRRHSVNHSKNEVTIQFLEKVIEDEKGAYTCTVCGKTDMFIRKYAYAHFRTHLPNETKTKNVCEICQKPCFSNNSLRLHMQTHQKLRFTCSTCKQKFETRKALMKHRMVHRRNDKFQCTQCDRAFPTRQIAIKHFRVHLPSKSKTKSKSQPVRAEPTRSSNRRKSTRVSGVSRKDENKR
uniref:Zinc finger protein 62 n=1 Tax=Culex pipiens TaxID=7175 RepID=A0A8D8EYB7_CULPI